jgi:hypothetical protein
MEKKRMKQYFKHIKQYAATGGRTGYRSTGMETFSKVAIQRYEV